jgi:ferredoxin-NADP reductase
MILQLVNKRKVAKGTVSFYWKPNKKIDYLPGQYMYYTLTKLEHKDSRGTTRHFTISSSPTETKKTGLITLTTRIRESSGFKKTLNDLKIGTEVEAEGPSGTFIVDENEKDPLVFLAGGIGITPFRSMIKYKIDKKLKTPIHLIYSNSVPEEITFKDELKKWSKQDSTFKLSMTVTKPKESKIKWTGLTGRVDAEMIKKLVKDIDKKTFWLCGPPAMVFAMERLLENMGIIQDKIISEKFSGY